MPQFSNFAKEAVLKHWFLSTEYVPANGYVAFSTFKSNALLSEGSLLNESTDVGRDIISFNTATNGYALNSAEVRRTPIIGGETLTHFAIMDDLNYGNVLAWNALDRIATTVAGQDAVAASGYVGVAFNEGALSPHVQNNTLNRMFCNTSVTIPMPGTWYIGLFNVPTTDGSTGEFTSGGYSRQPISWGPYNFSGGYGTVTGTGSMIEFTNLTDTTLSQWGVWDAPTGGNLLAYGVVSPSRAIKNNSKVCLDPTGVIVKL